MSSSAKPSTPNHYEVLELTPTATDQELRQAFRGLSKRYHPDTTTLPAPEAEAAFRQLRQSYAVLSDPVTRRSYDARLQQVPLPAAPLRQATVVVSRPVPVRRALSGGEWFALLLLAVALVLSLVLGIGVAWARGAELMAWPSWWGELATASTPATSASTPAFTSAALTPTAPPQPPAAPSAPDGAPPA